MPWNPIMRHQRRHESLQSQLKQQLVNILVFAAGIGSTIAGYKNNSVLVTVLGIIAAVGSLISSTFSHFKSAPRDVEAQATSRHAEAQAISRHSDAPEVLTLHTKMYRNVSSPIFDAPEFPTLRRIKPLPKRRKTSVSFISPDDKGLGSGSSRMLVAESNGVLHSLHMPRLPPIPLPLPGPNATAEELLVHADALQSYYLPILDAAAANISAVAD